jgi:uncharacterized protein (DUF433 family)
VLYRETYPEDLERVRSALPHLSPTQLEAALHYYADHQGEIDTFIAEHRRLLQEIATTS